MSAQFSRAASTTLEALAQGDPQAALNALRPALSHGHQAFALDGTSEQFAQAMGLFEKVAAHFADDAFVALIKASQQAPDSVDCLFELGFQLYEAELFAIGAAVLARASALQPDNPDIVAELVACLEADGQHQAALDQLDAHANHEQSQPIFAYLRAFNSIMIGDVAAARTAHQRFVTYSLDDNLAFMAARMERYLRRADKLAGHCSLDRFDLRGWHYVLCESILTTLSPYGFPTPMGGRYAMFGDSYAHCRLGLVRLQQCVDAWQLQPEVIFALPTRDAGILAEAAAQLMNLPVRPWPKGGTDTPSVILGYDISRESVLMDIPYDDFLDRQPGQLLYSHAFRFCDGFPLTPDVITILHQTVMTPWGETLRLGDDGPEVAPADSAAAATLSQRIVDANEKEELTGESGNEVTALADDFLAIVGPPTPGPRELFFANSPVLSARFS